MCSFFETPSNAPPGPGSIVPASKDQLETLLCTWARPTTYARPPANAMASWGLIALRFCKRPEKDRPHAGP
jgi:hypothetical protein